MSVYYMINMNTEWIILNSIILKILESNNNTARYYHLSLKKDPTELCSCKCHYGGAVSCPSCKENHGVECSHCKN